MPHSKRHIFFVTLIAWLSMLGSDFLLHAGLFAGLYQQSGPFLLPPLTALKLVPLGYFSFFLLTFLLVWLMSCLHLTGWRQGALFGLELGSLAWGAFMLGLGTISTASLSLLIAWFIGGTLELTVAGAVAGSGLAGMRLRRLLVIVLIGVVLAFILTIVLQSVGVVPATRI